MQAIEKFHEVRKNRHQYAQEWKQRTGRKIMGYFCSYTPEELIYAAGILPVRILGSHEPPDVTDRYSFGHFCPFSRDCLAQGLIGRYRYLDGITMSHGCMHMRQSFNSWRRNVPVSYSYYLYMPQNIQSQRAKDCFTEDIREFKRSLEEWTGESISQKALDKAIGTYNLNRRLLREIYDLRKSDAPAVSGAEAMDIVLSGMFMDKAEHNQLLETALKEIPRRNHDSERGARLMVIGSEVDPEFVSLLESSGAQVVTDDICSGSRYFWNDVVPAEDSLSAIAARYLNRPPCPLRDVTERRRLRHILDLVKDYNLDGVIIALQKFCEPHGFDNPAIERALKENDIPSLFLELDITLAPGQLRTRIEAFLEMIGLQLLI